jgi:GNAT superfamily N-acetyltransferase
MKEGQILDLVFGEYRISNDKTLLSVEKIRELLSGSYWANDRPVEIIEKAINNSDCYGVYLEKKQVGFARVVTDYATVYWLCDVIIDEKHRGKELGKKLMESIVESIEYKELRGILATKDAHGLYEQYGFVKAAEGRFMMRPSYKT